MAVLDLTTLLMKCPVLMRLQGEGYLVKPSPTMQTGIRFHEAMELAFQKPDEWKETVLEWEDGKLIVYLVQRTIDEFSLLFSYNKIETEVPVCMSFKSYKFIGLVDAILHTDAGVVLIDWKTTQRNEFRQSPLQLNVYAYILRKQDIPVEALYYIKVSYRKSRGYYTCQVVPVPVPMLDDEFIRRKLNELFDVWSRRDMPAVENCGFCALQEYCEPHLNEPVSDIVEQIKEPALIEGMLEKRDWGAFLEKKLKEGGNRYGC